jgi:DNA-nicking Smr family endonuclease
MAQIKKRTHRGLASGADSSKKEDPPLNNPFKAAREQLLGVLPKPTAAELEKKNLKPDPKGLPSRAKKGAAATPPEPAAEKLSDADLFLREIGGAVKLEKSARGREQPVETERAVLVRQSDEAEVYAQLSDLVEGIGAFDISDSDEYIEGIAPGLDRRLLARLRRGDFAVQGDIDLHGLTKEEARIRVEAFVHDSRGRGRRCVLIVHGRGLNSKDQIPVLKEAVRLWLTRGRISRGVLAFATARPTDGGAGAVYVLLRR